MASSSRSLRYVQNYGQVPIVENPDPTPLEQRMKGQLKRASQELRNAVRREKRLRQTVTSLRTALLEAQQINNSLSARLDAYKGEDIRFLLSLTKLEISTLTA